MWLHDCSHLFDPSFELRSSPVIINEKKSRFPFKKERNTHTHKKTSQEKYFVHVSYHEDKRKQWKCFNIILDHITPLFPLLNTTYFSLIHLIVYFMFLNRMAHSMKMRFRWGPLQNTCTGTFKNKKKHCNIKTKQKQL